jgi:hypothetical protein
MTTVKPLTRAHAKAKITVQSSEAKPATKPRVRH